MRPDLANEPHDHRVLRGARGNLEERDAHMRLALEGEGVLVRLYTKGGLGTHR